MLIWTSKIRLQFVFVMVCLCLSPASQADASDEVISEILRLPTGPYSAYVERIEQVLPRLVLASDSDHFLSQWDAISHALADMADRFENPLAPHIKRFLLLFVVPPENRRSVGDMFGIDPDPKRRGFAVSDSLFVDIDESRLLLLLRSSHSFLRSIGYGILNLADSTTFLKIVRSNFLNSGSSFYQDLQQPWDSRFEVSRTLSLMAFLDPELVISDSRLLGAASESLVREFQQDQSNRGFDMPAGIALLKSLGDILFEIGWGVSEARHDILLRLRGQKIFWMKLKTALVERGRGSSAHWAWKVLAKYPNLFDFMGQESDQREILEVTFDKILKPSQRPQASPDGGWELADLGKILGGYFTDRRTFMRARRDLFEGPFASMKPKLEELLRLQVAIEGDEVGDRGGGFVSYPSCAREIGSLGS